MVPVSLNRPESGWELSRTGPVTAHYPEVGGGMAFLSMQMRRGSPPMMTAWVGGLIAYADEATGHAKVPLRVKSAT